MRQVCTWLRGLHLQRWLLERLGGSVCTRHGGLHPVRGAGALNRAAPPPTRVQTPMPGADPARNAVMEPLSQVQTPFPGADVLPGVAWCRPTLHRPTLRPGDS
jgi:hypothetical protein